MGLIDSDLLKEAKRTFDKEGGERFLGSKDV